jgi:uridylate kinase
MSELKYKRVLLKISGEAFGYQENGGIDFERVREIARVIGDLQGEGVEVVVVNGAGNLFRGANQGKAIDREAADYIGMVATIMNSLALKEVLKESGLEPSIYSAIPMIGLIEKFDHEKANQDLSEGRVVLSTAGTGKPFFTTDTAGIQRAVDLKCDLMIKASTVDGVYTSDPKIDHEAEKFEEISYDEVLGKDLKVIDRAAVEIAKDNNLEIIVCKFDKESLLKAIQGREIGTKITK